MYTMYTMDLMVQWPNGFKEIKVSKFQSFLKIDPFGIPLALLVHIVQRKCKICIFCSNISPYKRSMTETNDSDDIYDDKIAKYYVIC